MQTPSRRAVVLNHLAFEDLGSLEAPLQARGFGIETIDVATARFPLHEAANCDLLVVLGGPIGVYDRDDYPFLNAEIALLAERLASRRPVLGICLGAQLMAAALGARVYAGGQGAEIGWAPLQTASAGPPPAWFAPLLAPAVQVFHWHGDTFDLPPGATYLASSRQYAQQAFALDDFALGLQFHPEVTATGLERWYVGHACELRHAGLSAVALRASAARQATALEGAAGRFWELWLGSLGWDTVPKAHDMLPKSH